MANNKLKKLPTSKDDVLEQSIEEDKSEVTLAIEKVVSIPEEDEEYPLLCGYTDAQGVLHKTYTVREMNGLDEEALGKPDVKSNATKAINVLLARCVTSVGTLVKKDYDSPTWANLIKSMYSGDQDLMLLTIRRISLGDEIVTHHVCPNHNCKQKLETVLKISELDTVPFNGNRVVHFELPRGYTDSKGVVHKEGTMGLTTGVDREILTPLAKKNLARANTVLLTRLCKFDDGAYIDEDVMAHLTTRDREYLSGLLMDNSFGIKLEVDVECPSCGETFTASLNAVNFME